MRVMINIKKFQPKDIFSVLKLANNCLTETYNPSIFNYFYESFPEGFIVAENNHKIIGFIVAVNSFNKLGRILMLAVDDRYRKKRIGSKMLNNALYELSKIQVNNVELEVRTQNKTAINFYKKNGFNIVERINCFYQNGEDAFIMKKEL